MALQILFEKPRLLRPPRGICLNFIFPLLKLGNDVFVIVHGFYLLEISNNGTRGFDSIHYQKAGIPLQLKTVRKIEKIVRLKFPDG